MATSESELAPHQQINLAFLVRAEAAEARVRELEAAQMATSKPDNLTFAELRLANLLANKPEVLPASLEPGVDSIGAALASMVIHADYLAASHGIDLGQAIRRQFVTATPLLPAHSPLADILNDWDQGDM